MTLDDLKPLLHSPVRNYAIPGLTSWIVGAPPSEKGCVRLFSCERNHEEPITPHTHRFDFHCIVLAGEVHNVLWEEADEDDLDADEFVLSGMRYGGDIGGYENIVGRSSARWKKREEIHKAGDVYGMTHNEFHSIYFKRNSLVLFFEGPQKTNFSYVLEPYCMTNAGTKDVVSTFEVRPWMFQKG